jgi:hypothetical protein
MPIHSVQAQESWECQGIPFPVNVEADGTPAPTPPGWGRRDWVLREAALLGAEAIPSPPLSAAVEIEIVR